MPPLNTTAARVPSEQPMGPGAEQPAPDALEEVLRDIAADARDEPARYLDDTRVPEGGE